MTVALHLLKLQLATPQPEMLDYHSQRFPLEGVRILHLTETFMPEMKKA